MPTKRATLDSLSTAINQLRTDDEMGIWNYDADSPIAQELRDLESTLADFLDQKRRLRSALRKERKTP